MNIDNFNKAIYYIEENITNEIDYKKFLKWLEFQNNHLIGFFHL